MMQCRPFAAWLRPVAGLFALVAVLALSACGGGSGAPNNPYAPVPVTVELQLLPASPTIYSQVATTLTISGGVPPYRAFSSNPAVLPVTQNVTGNTITLLAGSVTALTTVTITVQDSSFGTAVGSDVATPGTATADVTILPGPATPPPALVVLPTSIDVYSTVAAQLSISGGVPPYRAFSNNSTVLPVAQNVSGNALMLLAAPVTQNTAVVVTVEDAVNQTVDVNVTVHPKAAAGPPLTVLPDTVTTSKGIPVTLTISGGTSPYKAYSSNPSVIPVNQNVSGSSLTFTAADVAVDTDVTITIQDSAGQTVTVAVTVTPEPSAPPPPLVVLPSPAIAFSNVLSTLSVSGGVPPYQAFSSNAAVLPVTQAVASGVIPLFPSTVATDTAVTITVQDSASTTASASVTVRPSTLINAIVIKPNSTDCGTNAICSGQTGTATVTLTVPGGGPASGRQVRFDVVAGPYGIVVAGGTPSSAPTVPSLIVTSDASGIATVNLRADNDAPTQPAQIRATDLTSGQQVTADFLVQQRTDGATLLTVVPSEVNITGPFVDVCSAGFRVDYYIYGGTPPYRVTPSFPDAVTILNNLVTASGGFFRAITNGTCVNPVTFSIVDATGRQTSATLNNVPGSAAIPTPPEPSDLVVTPGNQNVVLPSGQSCADQQYKFVITGGTRPYNVYATPAGDGQTFVQISKQVINPGDADPTTSISNVVVNPTTVSFVDSSSPPQTVQRTITCTVAP
jgi:hypothetical protein